MPIEEMFKSIGYIIYPDSHYIEYRKEEGEGCYTFIQFNKVLKRVSFGYYDIFEFRAYVTYMYPEVTLAVVQQMKELGWIK